MPLDPRIPLGIDFQQRDPVGEYAQIAQIKNALAQQKAQEAELKRQENMQNAMKSSIDPNTGEVDWNNASASVAQIDPMAALSLRGEMSKERAAGLDAQSKEFELASKRIDVLDSILTSVTDEASYQAGKRQAERIFGPELVQGLPPTFDGQAQAMVQQARNQALEFKDRLAIMRDERKFGADEAQRRRDYEIRSGEHFDKTGERLPPYESASGGMTPGYTPGAPMQGGPDRMPGVIYDWDKLEGDPNDRNTPAGFNKFMEQVAPILSGQLNVPADELHALPAIESGMNPGAVSPTGVEGPMQLTEATGASMGLDRDEPMQNVYGGAQYYAQLRNEFGDPALAAAAYNSGPDAVRKAVAWSEETGFPWEQSGYVRPEGVAHARKMTAQLESIQRWKEAKLAEARANTKAPAVLREKENAIENEARQAELEAVTDQASATAPEPMTADEKERYGLPADAPYVMTKDGPKLLEKPKPAAGELSQKDRTRVKEKLITIGNLKAQLATLKAALLDEKGKNKISDVTGFLQGRIPGGMSKRAGTFDAAVDALRGSVSAIKRVPGVGSMSDWEGRLDQAPMPSRTDHDDVIATKVQNLEDLVAGFENGYLELLGDEPADVPVNTPPPSALPEGVKITRTK